MLERHCPSGGGGWAGCSLRLPSGRREPWWLSPAGKCPIFPDTRGCQSARSGVKVQWTLWLRLPHTIPLPPTQYACHPFCPGGRDSRNLIISHCPFILAFPLTHRLGAQQKAGQFELTVDKFCGQKPGIQSTERAFPERKGLELPTGEQLSFP